MVQPQRQESLRCKQSRNMLESSQNCTQVVISPADEEQKQKQNTDQQHQVWYHFWLQVLLVIGCTIPGLKLDLVCWGYRRIQAGLLHSAHTL